MEVLYCLLAALTAHTSSSARVSLSSDTEQQLIRSLLGNASYTMYDWRIRPRGTRREGTLKSPVMVTVNMYLRTISKVDDVNMEYSLHFTFREEWLDERLIFSDKKLKYINLTPELRIILPGQRIWMPDTFFQNEKDGKKHDIDTPNVLLRVYNGTGRILYSVRMTLTLSCPMMLHNYPMDIQQCLVEFASYAYTTDDIDYMWVTTKKPVQIKSGLRQSLPSFTLADVETGTCTSTTNTGTYSCLRLTLVLKREFSYYMLQLYIPSFMLVAVSWVSFWLDKDSVPARVTLGVTTLLTMTTQASGINAKLPPVSYTKAIDVWIGVCLAFIFGALLEFALINYAARRDMLQMSKRKARSSTRPRQPANTIVNYNPMIPGASTIGTAPSAPIDDRGCARLGGIGEHEFALMADGVDPRAPTSDLEMQELMHHQQHNSTAASRRSTYHHHPAATNRPSHTSGFTRSLFGRFWRVSRHNSAKRIDVMARIVFPVTFVAFNCVYWIIYLRPYLEQENKLGDLPDPTTTTPATI